jgi:hypothetical protein
MIERITNLGDAALLLPASLLLFLHLLWRDDAKRAFAFALATGACLTITVALKLAFLIWHFDVFGFRVHSPSGHTSFGATFYGCFAVLASSGIAPWRQKIVRLSVGALILAVALSRVAVDRPQPVGSRHRPRHRHCLRGVVRQPAQTFWSLDGASANRRLRRRHGDRPRWKAFDSGAAPAATGPSPDRRRTMKRIGTLQRLAAGGAARPTL